MGKNGWWNKGFSEKYRGYLTSLDGPKMDKTELDFILEKIKQNII